MVEQDVGSIVVVDAAGELAGIVTDRDLRRRVVAVMRSADDPVAAIMSAPVVTVKPEMLVLEALLAMTRRDIHHLVVVEAGRVVGVVSSDDLLRVQTSTPLELSRRIQACGSMAALADLMSALNEGVRHLFEQGLSGYQMGRVVAELNDFVIRRVLGFVERDLDAAGDGQPPLPYCWLVLGSEGRREQTLRTDQDNALVYEDPPAGFLSPAERYFDRFAGRVVEALVALGYPRCPGDAMASNPRWRQPLGIWREYFAGWIREPDPQNLLYASIYFDFRPVAGREALATALRNEIRTRVGSWRSFPRHLAKLAVSHAPPLGMFSRFRLARADGRRGIDLKLNGLLIVVNALRTIAIDLGLDEVNTLERLEAATTRGRFTQAEAEDVRDAYETMFSFRLRHQLARMAAGQQPDNFVDPLAMSRADQRRLEEAFRAVRRLQGKIEMRYFTEAL
jgi:CBS domain-containing protein